MLENKTKQQASEVLWVLSPRRGEMLQPPPAPAPTSRPPVPVVPSSGQVQVALTLFFNRSRSFRVRVSALAMTGTMFTLLCIAFIKATSKGFNPCPKGEMK